VLLSLALVLGLEMFSRTKSESLALALTVKFLALANQVLGLARRVIFSQTNTATMLKTTGTTGIFSEWTTVETTQGTDVRH